LTIINNNGSVQDKNFIKSVIFDCDGVLVNSEPFSCQALNILFEKYFKIDIGVDYSEIIGKSLQDTFEYYFKKYEFENIDEKLLLTLYQEKDEVYMELAKDKLKQFPGISQFINHCITNDICIAVASSGTLEKIKFSLNETGLTKYFDIIISADQVENGKPSPDIFLYSAKKLNLDPKHCLVIEDSLSGIIAGNKAGMFTVAISNTFPREKLKEANPNLIVERVMELI
jgi:HAD superfamily hydrolase (TIGR01509 family)